MRIEMHNRSVRELLKSGFTGLNVEEELGYWDDPERGAYAMDGKLCCRPRYQREFVYNEKQRDKVIDTVLRGLPLNVMYWMERPDFDELGNPKYTYDGKPINHYEIMDGQQRTLSILQFIANEYSARTSVSEKELTWASMPQDLKQKLLDYELMIYVCTGTDSERLEWFRTVNIAGEKLNDQEMLNAIYSGPFIERLKTMFSRTNAPAYNSGAHEYMRGSGIRQDYLATILRWISARNNMSVTEYLAAHTQDPDEADNVWKHFTDVIAWVENTFPTYRGRLMQGLPWGEFYNKYHENDYDPNALETRIKELLLDDDVTKQSGVYEYLLSNGAVEKALNIRQFSDKDKRRKYEEQNGVCVKCGNHFEYSQMAGDHIIAWSRGGHTTYDNLQMLCRECNARKSDN